MINPSMATPVSSTAPAPVLTPTPMPTPTPVAVTAPASVQQPSQKIAVPAMSGGVVGALVILITLTLDHFHTTVPAQGTAALMIVLSPIVHWLALRMGFDK
jgi:hypothetical protein